MIDLLIFLIKPIKVYKNSQRDKLDIFSENRLKAGIYLWYNNVNDKYYVGSSSNIARRMAYYFSLASLRHPSNNNMVICQALLKYNHSSFSLMVLEYCEVSNLLHREQYWIDTLNPNYNVLRYAYNFFGYKPTPESILLMSQSAIIRVHAESTKEKISGSMKGENNHFFGKNHTVDSLAKIVLAKSLSSVFLYNEYKELTCIFTSATQFAKLVKSNHLSIKRFIESGDLFRGNWYITRELIKDSDIPLIEDHSTEEYKKLIQTIIDCKHIRKAVYVFSPEYILVAKYDGVMDAEKALHISHETIKMYCKTGKVYDGRFVFSYHNLDKGD